MEVENFRSRRDSIKNVWNHCLYCDNTTFKAVKEFARLVDITHHQLCIKYILVYCLHFEVTSYLGKEILI